jgi:lipopolysaccharide transport system ATP-binding protein
LLIQFFISEKWKKVLQILSKKKLNKMSQVVISVENLSKRYLIGHENAEKYVAVRDQIANNIKNIGKKANQLFRGGEGIDGINIEEFWALKDISFNINAGERVGIVGRNGAGKSTLLKILSRIHEPTNGKVKIKGRVASLLEVGTGFHPELTGRENIYLNGAILGMNRKEITKKFDEIVDFSGVEKFLDTPVKRYSSGMYVRLAFSVAANLESEILIVDEVLAVGDAEFQKKCLGKLGEVQKGDGRTVLFVSHNVAALRGLCTKGLLLENGSIKCQSDINTILASYVQHPNNQTVWLGKDGSTEITINKTYIKPILNTINVNSFSTDQDLEIGIELEINENIREVGVGCIILTAEGMPIVRLFFNDFNEITKLDKNKYLFRFVIPAYHLSKGEYQIQFDISLPNIQKVNSEKINLNFNLVSNGQLGNRYNSDSHPLFTSILRPNWFKDISII